MRKILSIALTCALILTYSNFDTYASKDYNGTTISTRREETRPTLRIGDRGEYVKELQKSLNVYFPGKIDVDGVFGSQTLTYVKKFQQMANINADGIVGSNTWFWLDYMGA